LQARARSRKPERVPGRDHGLGEEEARAGLGVAVDRAQDRNRALVVPVVDDVTSVRIPEKSYASRPSSPVMAALKMRPASASVAKNSQIGFPTTRSTHGFPVRTE
jgi:hypothetical protein